MLHGMWPGDLCRRPREPPLKNRWRRRRQGSLLPPSRRLPWLPLTHDVVVVVVFLSCLKSRVNGSVTQLIPRRFVSLPSPIFFRFGRFDGDFARHPRPLLWRHPRTALPAAQRRGAGFPISPGRGPAGAGSDPGRNLVPIGCAGPTALLPTPIRFLNGARRPHFFQISDV